MRATASIFLLLLGACVANVNAQTRKTAAKPTNAKPKNVLLPIAYLGEPDKLGGPIKKDDFSRLVKLGVKGKDSTGTRYVAHGFEFVFAERMLYEDSIGNLQLMTDYLSQICLGDTLPGVVANSISERAKVGDTLIFKSIGFVKENQPANIPLLGKGMRFYIIK